MAEIMESMFFNPGIFQLFCKTRQTVH
jgi:hypothetical protein